MKTWGCFRCKDKKFILIAGELKDDFDYNYYDLDCPACNPKHQESIIDYSIQENKIVPFKTSYKTVYKIDKDDNILAIYKNMNQAAAQNNITAELVADYCKNKHKHKHKICKKLGYGFRFEYKRKNIFDISKEKEEIK